LLISLPAILFQCLLLLFLHNSYHSPMRSPF